MSALTELSQSRLRNADLLLDALAELLGMGDHDERFWGASGAADDYGAVAEHPAEKSFLYGDAFDLVQHHVEGPAAGHAGFDQHAAVGDGHFRGVTLCQAVGEDDQRNQQERRADRGQRFRANRVELLNAAAVFLGDGVGQNHGTRYAQQQSDQHGADQDDPV